MANKNVFGSVKQHKITKANTHNRAGGKAYSLDAEEQLSHLACTGTFADNFYSSAEEQLSRVIELADSIDPKFLGQLALYSRNKGYMKDMPAVLCAILSIKDVDLFSYIFPKVINDGKMIRNFVQIIRSGVIGRKSLGTAPKRAIQNWFNTHDANYIFKNSVGADPSLSDVIRLAHVSTEGNKQKEALFKYLLGYDTYNKKHLPSLVKEIEAFRNGKSDVVPEVPMLLLTSSELSDTAWKAIAKNASWQTARMNLNTFQRHNVFNDSKLVNHVAETLENAEYISTAKVFPYQLFTAYNNVTDDMPKRIIKALHNAVELSTKNVPSLEGVGYVAVDSSGSMGSALTGNRGTATSKATCIDVAALIGSTLGRVCEDCSIIPFSNSVINCKIDCADSILSNAKKLSDLLGGGTNCSAPLEMLNAKNAKGDYFIIVSDNESWVDSGRRGETETMRQWSIFKKRNPRAKMICIDLCAYGTVQAPNDKSVLNLAGFNDSVFEVIERFICQKDGKQFVQVINNYKVPDKD